MARAALGAVRTYRSRRAGGRLLNEFLVSLGLFFLILTASLVILGSASRSAVNASVTSEALALAREGMEEAIASGEFDKPSRREESFGWRENDVTYSRVVKVTPLTGDMKSFCLIRVDIESEDSDRKILLERYVYRI